jgi:hypothetical protein
MELLREALMGLTLTRIVVIRNKLIKLLPKVGGQVIFVIFFQWR